MSLSSIPGGFTFPTGCANGNCHTIPGIGGSPSRTWRFCVPGPVGVSYWVSVGFAGATGVGVAPGGSAGAVLIKNTVTNYDTQWSDLVHIRENGTIKASFSIGIGSATNMSTSTGPGATGNIIIGAFSAIGISGGSNNVVIGVSSGLSLGNNGNSYANSNVAIGNSVFNHSKLSAGVAGVTSSFNTFIGTESGEYIGNKVDCNVGVGAFSLAGSTNGTSCNVGSRNTAVGSFAGLANTTGCNNIYIGASAGAGNTSGSNSIFIGVDCFVGITAGKFSSTCVTPFARVRDPGNNRIIVGNSNTCTTAIAGYVDAVLSSRIPFYWCYGFNNSNPGTGLQLYGGGDYSMTQNEINCGRLYPMNLCLRDNAFANLVSSGENVYAPAGDTVGNGYKIFCSLVPPASDSSLVSNPTLINCNTMLGTPGWMICAMICPSGSAAYSNIHYTVPFSGSCIGCARAFIVTCALNNVLYSGTIVGEFIRVR